MRVILLLSLMFAISCSNEKETIYYSCNEDGLQCSKVATFYGSQSSDYCNNFDKTFTFRCVYTHNNVSCKHAESTVFPRGLKSYCRSE